MEYTHYNSWTGLPCNCPWGKPHGRIAKLAGQEVNRILKAPDKALRGPRGEEFKSVLPKVVGEDYDSLAPYIANRWKKGDIQFHPGYRDPESQRATESGLYYRNQFRENDPEFQARPVDDHDFPGYTHGWSRLDRPQLQRWNRWYQARQHPTRRGVNVMDPGFTPAEMDRKTQEHQEALERERMLKEDLSQGDIVHKFDDGWHIRHLTSPGTNAEDALEAEGKAMGHCIGSEDQPYLQNAVNGDIDVYSLRDKKGWPHGTWHTNPDGSIAEIHGNNNKSLSPEQHEKYEEWCAANGKDPEPVGHQAEDPNAGDEEIEVPGAEDIDTYLDHHHPYSDAHYYEDAHDYGTVGENTNVYPGEPQWDQVAQNLAYKDPKERQDFYNTVHANGSHHYEPLRKALQDPDLEKYRREFENNHKLHYDAAGNYVYPQYNSDWGINPNKGWQTGWNQVNQPMWTRPNEYSPYGVEPMPDRPEINASWKFGNTPPEIVELGEDEVRTPRTGERPGALWMQSRRPFAYHEDDNQVVIGPRGVFHSQIDPWGYGAHGAILLDGKFKGGHDMIRSWGNVPMHILQAVSDHTGIPIDPDEGSGWKFGANPETGEGYEWNFSEPHVTTKFPEGWDKSFEYNENNTRGRQRIPFAWTHHPEDINDVKLYMGHPGSYHDQLHEMHGIPFEELIGGYGSVKPRSYQTGNGADREQHIEYYTVHDPRAMGSVADELTRHFDVKNNGFKNEPYRKPVPDNDEYDYEMQQGHFGAFEVPEPSPDYRSTKDLVKPEEIEPWEKGQPGKWIGLPSGEVLSWKNQLSPHWHADDENPEWKYDGWPSHDAVLEALDKPYNGDYTYGQIRPSGEVVPYPESMKHPSVSKHMNALKARYPEVYPTGQDPNEWKFS